MVLESIIILVIQPVLTQQTITLNQAVLLYHFTACANNSRELPSTAKAGDLVIRHYVDCCLFVRRLL
jgi:hypothetical protein